MSAPPSSSVGDGPPYTVSPFSSLSAGRGPSGAQSSYKESSLSCLTTLSYALYDQFLHLISSIDAQLNHSSHRAMLRTVTDSVREERDRFTHYLATLDHFPHPTPLPPAPSHPTSASPSLQSFDLLDLFRLQRRLQLHYTVWNRAIAELYAFFFPVKGAGTPEVGERMEAWMRVMEERKERGEWEEIQRQADSRQRSEGERRGEEAAIELKDIGGHHHPISPRGVSYEAALSPRSPMSPQADGGRTEQKEEDGSDGASAAPLSAMGSMPSTPLTGASLSPDVSSLGVTDSGDEGDTAERPTSAASSSPRPPERGLHNLRESYEQGDAGMDSAAGRGNSAETELKEAMAATAAFAQSTSAESVLRHSHSDQSVSLSAQGSVQLPSSQPISLSSSASLPSPSLKSLPSAAPIVRSRSRSSSPMGASTPLSFLSSSIFPSLSVLPTIPQVGPESLFASIAPFPSSSVDFLRPSPFCHYSLPPLPHSLPVFVYEDEPSSIIAYTLASFDHLQAVGRLSPADVPLLKYLSVHHGHHELPSYLLPSHFAQRSQFTATRKASSSVLHIKTNYARPSSSSSAQRSPWSFGDRTPTSAVSPSAEAERSPLPPPPSSDAVDPGHVPPHLSLDALYAMDERRDSAEAVERLLLSDDKAHLKLTFEDLPGLAPSSSGFALFSSAHADRTTFTCTAYFPVQFHALRLFFCAGDRSFLASLAHSSKWSTTAGKSGSTFAKTKDDRYVLKFIKVAALPSIDTFPACCACPAGCAHLCPPCCSLLCVCALGGCSVSRWRRCSRWLRATSATPRATPSTTCRPSWCPSWAPTRWAGGRAAAARRCRPTSSS